ncbi:VOC family protein [Hyphomicrobium sp.]|jgi:lactoylglutathione lyase|uniref:VOC family protein n=1 Tax=Hyphomicrobium sp. TaxID=82 RepID=UPI0035619F9D
MAKAIHMMVRVLDEARSVKFYESCFDLKIADRKEWPDFSLTYLKNAENDFEVELTVNKGRTEPYDLGNGYGHIAFAVDDLEATRAKIVAAGYQPKDIKTMTFDGKPFGTFFFIDDPDGYKIEVLQRGGRFQ